MGGMLRQVSQWVPIMMEMSDVLLTMEELRDRDELVVELAAQFRSYLARSSTS